MNEVVCKLELEAFGWRKCIYPPERKHGSVHMSFGDSRGRGKGIELVDFLLLVNAELAGAHVDEKE